MLVVLAITGVAIAGLTEISWLSFDWINKFSTKVDVNIAAKRALDRIGTDIRMASAVGDSYDVSTDTSPTFPCAINPIYSGGLPAGASTSYQLDDNTLVIQMPVFNQKGWPTALPLIVDPKQRRNLDTVVYEVVQDPDPNQAAQGKFVLNRFCFAGIHDTSQILNVAYGHTICPGQTILTGITGPLDKITNKPVIFQALDEQDPGGNPISLKLFRTYALSRINGIVVNVELSRSQSSNKNATTASYRSEIFMRNRHFGD